MNVVIYAYMYVYKKIYMHVFVYIYLCIFMNVINQKYFEFGDILLFQLNNLQ